MISSQRGESKMGDVIGGSSSSRDVTELADMMDALSKLTPIEISIKPVNEDTPFQFIASDDLLAIMGSSEPVVKAYLLEKVAASNHDILRMDKEPTTKQQNINDDDDDDWESCPCYSDVEDADVEFDLDKRPTSLYDVKFRSRLEVCGHIKGYNTRTKTLWVGGLVPCLADLVNITTNCKRILLAVNEHTWWELLRYVAKHLDDYVVVRVAWDTASYCFLRKLAQCVPGLTFIAVTDLYNHNLDLLSFLDTSPNELLTHYKLDLSEECSDAGVSQDSTVNIKWLGLRPSDIDTYGACFEAHSWKLCQSDFKMVNDRLLSDPSFCRKEAWKAELKLLQDHPIFMPFMLISPNRGTRDSNYIHNEYLDKKLDKKDWV